MEVHLYTNNDVKTEKNSPSPLNFFLHPIAISVVLENNDPSRERKELNEN